MKAPSEIVLRPLISEKSYTAMTASKYVFRVRVGANKTEIKRAIQGHFKVDVVSVNTERVRGKERRRGRFHGFTADWKKATVTLKSGQKIENLFEGV
jgi:large subunit ribosomal protein L23